MHIFLLLALCALIIFLLLLWSQNQEILIGLYKCTSIVLLIHEGEFAMEDDNAEWEWKRIESKEKERREEQTEEEETIAKEERRMECKKKKVRLQRQAEERE